jgi:LruC domain-containing protein
MVSKYFVLLIAFAFLAACEKETQGPVTSEQHTLENIQVDPAFNYATNRTVATEVRVTDAAGQPVPRVRFDIYSLAEEAENRIGSAATGDDGVLSIDIALPSYVTEVVLRTPYLGIVPECRVPVTGDRIDVTYHRGVPDIAVDPTAKNSAPLAKVTAANYRFLGGYDANGVPDYLEPVSDVITADFINDINASLPENSNVTINNPEYLASGNQVSTVMKEAGEVFVTFVHEGAGYKNVLGFFTYPLGATPASVADIDSITIVFPNVSYLNSGGGLHSGARVNIGYFPANTVIAWVLIADGWRGSVTAGNWTLYSEANLNPEADPALRQHNVILHDNARNISLLGFEDIRRDYGGDKDFNDALFYVSAVPYTAIESSNQPQITYSGTDFDGDGIMNHVDQYPLDPARAFNNYYPSEMVMGTLAFEDMWPVQGDYDFNDLVVDYNFNQIMNAQNQVVELDTRFVIKAIGARNRNGFGIRLPVAAGEVSLVTGARSSNGLVSLNSNMTEMGQNDAVIIVSDDVMANMDPAGGSYINTLPSDPFITPDTIRVRIVFNRPMDMAVLGTPPYDPFLIIDQQRGKEVHLAGEQPTDMADVSLFGSGDDATVPGTMMTYKTALALPWALDLTNNWTYPQEKDRISDGYKYFVPWAESSGTQHSDWHLARPDNIVNSHLYVR